jgi:group I intron endonuclease
MAYIYKIVNDINNKVYIGKTEFSIEKRFSEHCKDSVRRNEEKRPLYNAMNKYGIEHFHIELIEETDKPEEREVYWIQQFNSYYDGYNATLGGDGKSYLDRQLLINTYLQNHNLALTAEILNIDAGYLSKILKENNIEVKTSQEINKEKRGKKVEQYNLKGEYIQTFASIKDATKAVKPNSNLESTHGHISQVCNGKRKTAYGYIWKFASPE